MFKSIFVVDRNELILTSNQLLGGRTMPYEVETVSIQDIFKICLNTSTDSSVQWLQFRISIESFLLKNT